MTAEADGSWRALVKNYSTAPQTRSWHIVEDGVAGPAATLTLEPGQVRTLAGAFPPERRKSS